MALKPVNAKLTLWLLIAAGCTVLAFSFAVQGYEQTWRSLGIIPYSPHFADVRGITASAESHALGYDPLLNNPRDPWGRPMNYPRIWQVLFYLGIDQRDTIYFEVVLVSLFLLGIFLFIGDIDQPIAWALACAIFSPAVLLGIERGNNDLLIFFLLALSLAVIRKSAVAAAGIIAFAFLLKLYPVFAASVFLREKKSRALGFLAGSVAFAGIFGALMRNEIRMIRAATPSGMSVSYGIGVICQIIGLVEHNSMLWELAGYGVVVAIALHCAYRGWCRREPHAAASDSHIDAFRVGASIYIGTYFLGTNFDYRLMFLLFTIPQLTAWMSGSEPRLRRIARLALACNLCALWSMFVARFLNAASMRLEQIIFDVLAKGAVLCCLTYLFVYSSPQWVRPFSLRRKPALV
jgi:hypothetical protein